MLIARYYLPGRLVLYSDNNASVTYERPLPSSATVVIYEPRAWPKGVSPDRSVGVADAWSLELVNVPAGVLRLPGIDVDVPRR